ncbi:L-ribulose-5-phosphate 4-epimerase [Brevibacillus sp. WF146]|uniref:L-ribulose-5-phosphate 4-epimerase n=1 Tax=Brevibacillus sp. WF146 TaxID=319501 RepID=UPI0007ED5C6E|nr:L-ribulose-5-phosphate 4-epimerase [Brevibacillus sp. WF146]UYZ12265.1 L-ribulose-5-phosphate 4-epimerase [Brevibacillus sp. WF146]
MLETLKETVCTLNLQLPKNGLVTMTSGNVSARDRETGYVVIKPSGIPYEQLTPRHMVVVDTEGHVVEGEYMPSVDTETHLYIYKHRGDVNGVVHTHSPYATSFAALGRGIPPVLTSIADMFGGEIPVGPYASVGGEEIGRAVVGHIGHSPAILLKNHGVFTIGPTPQAALKAAVVLEDVAKIVHLAMLKGTPAEIPESEVTRAHHYYQTMYGQKVSS